MPGGKGSKKMSTTARERELRDPSSAENLRQARERQVRFRGGRFASAEQVKSALSGSVGNYLAVLDALAVSAEDPRVKMDAARYLIDRVAGKPTEKVQQEISQAPAVMPSEAQLEALAKRALEGPQPRVEESEDDSPTNDAPEVH
jgi:hypothetical protein